MSTNPKKYYWLKLKDDFFMNPKIKKLRKIAGGDTYTIILQKIMLLSIKSEGLVEFQHIEKTFSEELALILDEETINVEVTLQFMNANGLIESNDDEHFILPFIPELIGSEVDSAERVRRLRNKRKEQIALHCNGEVTECNIEKEKEKEKEIDIKKGKPSLVDAYALEDEALTEQGKEVLNKFTAYRKTIKAPIKTTAPLKAFITTLRNAMKQGFKYEDIINLMESKEWQTIKIEWIAKELTPMANNQPIPSSTDIQGLMKNLRITA